MSKWIMRVFPETRTTTIVALIPMIIAIYEVWQHTWYAAIYLVFAIGWILKVTGFMNCWKEGEG